MSSAPLLSPEGPPRLAVRALGRIALEVDGSPAVELTSQPKRLGLFLFMTLARPGQLIRREELLVMFWPELPESAARAALSQALSFLRRALGEDRIVTRGPTEVGVNQVGLTCDVFDFDRSVDAGQHVLAISLYGGTLLPGLSVPGTEGLDEWLDLERERLRRRYIDSLEVLAHAAEACGKPASAREWWERLTFVEPLSDKYAAGLIRSLFAAGERSAALRHAEVYGRRLDTELGISAGPEFRAAVEAAKEGKPAQPVGTPSTQPAPIDVAIDPASQIGRTSSRTPVRRRWLLVTAMGAIGATAFVLTWTRNRSETAVEERVLVATFVDRSGQERLAGLGELAAGWIIDGLVREGGLPVVDPVGAMVLTQSYRSQLTDRTPADSIVALAREARVSHVVTGALHATSDSVAFSARVLDVARRRIIGEVRVRVPHSATGQGVQELRDKTVGLIAASRNRTLGSLGMPDITPPNLTAYRRFVEGIEHFKRNEMAAALEPFLAAARADTMFVLPLVWARYAASNSGNLRVYDSLGTVITRVLRALQDRLSPLERAALASESAQADTSVSYYRAAVTEAARIAPGSNFSFLLGDLESIRFRYKAALQSYQKVDRGGWLGAWAGVPFSTAYTSHMLGQYQRQLEVAQAALIHVPGSGVLRQQEAGALAALGRDRELQSSLEAAVQILSIGDRPGEAALGVLMRAGAELYVHQSPDASREVFARVLRWALDRPEDFRPEDRVNVSLYLGDWARAESLLVAMLHEAERAGRPVAFGRLGELGAVRARLGRTSEARALSYQITLDTTARPRAWMEPHRYEQLLARASIAAALGEGDSAIALLGHARSAVSEGFISFHPGWRIDHNPFFDAFRSDPRFRRIVDDP